MAKPTAVTEFGTAKVMLLADSGPTTPGAYAPSAVVGGTSSESTYPVAWMGVATHRRGDAIGSAGGFTPGSAPVVAVAGYDNSVAGTVRALRTDENGVLIVKHQGAIDLPLQQPTTGVSISAASEQGFTSADAIRYSYLQRLQLICVGTVPGGTNSGSWTIKNGQGGTVIQIIPGPFATPGGEVGKNIVVEFPTPHKTGGTGGSFTITPSSTFLGTWQCIANGYRSVL